jgi:adenine phosphoribosyltransferase
MDLRALVREIPDFPQPGILFRDITPLLLDPDALDAAITQLAASVAVEVDFVVAAEDEAAGLGGFVPAEARGFILGAALARQLHAGFGPARKPGKLPSDTVSAEYALEYGLDSLEVHADALADGARVLVHDDLLATGGTARALCELVSSLGGEIVGCSFLVELSALQGRARLAPHPVRSLITFEG